MSSKNSLSGVSMPDGQQPVYVKCPSRRRSQRVEGPECTKCGAPLAKRQPGTKRYRINHETGEWTLLVEDLD